MVVTKLNLWHGQKKLKPKAQSSYLVLQFRFQSYSLLRVMKQQSVVAPILRILYNKLSVSSISRRVLNISIGKPENSYEHFIAACIGLSTVHDHNEHIASICGSLYPTPPFIKVLGFVCEKLPLVNVQVTTLEQGNQISYTRTLQLLETKTRSQNMCYSCWPKPIVLPFHSPSDSYYC